MRTPEQDDLAAMLKGWLADHATTRDAHSERVAPPSMKEVAELGLLDMLLPGEGGTLSDLALVQQAFSAACASQPAAASALARGVLAGLGIEPLGILLPVSAPRGGTPLRVRGSGPHQRVSGRVEAVTWADAPDGLVVSANDADGRTYLVEVDPGEVTVHQRRVLDLTRAFVSVEFVDARPAAVHEADSSACLQDALTLLCLADALGSAGRTLELTLEHVRTREQFGRVIGSFQAVKHHCASMRVDLASAAAALDAAVASWGSPGSTRAAASAAAHGLPSCGRVASLAVQLHGGMGFTWEHDLHLYLRRVKTDELQTGAPRAHLDRLVSLL